MEIMDTKILILAFIGLVVLFAGAILAKKGFKKIEDWQKENQFKFAFIAAAIVAVVIAVWAGQNQDLIECWKYHKAQCLFPMNR
jgi:Kef-type K+ transport system membrane component KefB